jgi:hypothetical protein
MSNQQATVEFAATVSIKKDVHGNVLDVEVTDQLDVVGIRQLIAHDASDHASADKIANTLHSVIPQVLPQILPQVLMTEPVKSQVVHKIIFNAVTDVNYLSTFFSTPVGTAVMHQYFTSTPGQQAIRDAIGDLDFTTKKKAATFSPPPSSSSASGKRASPSSGGSPNKKPSPLPVAPHPGRIQPLPSGPLPAAPPSPPAGPPVPPLPAVTVQFGPIPPMLGGQLQNRPGYIIAGTVTCTVNKAHSVILRWVQLETLLRQESSVAFPITTIDHMIEHFGMVWNWHYANSRHPLKLQLIDLYYFVWRDANAALLTGHDGQIDVMINKLRTTPGYYTTSARFAGLRALRDALVKAHPA